MQKEALNAIFNGNLHGTLELLETTREIFSFNLKRLRGDRTQRDIAEAVDVSLASYQRMESGVIPRTPGIFPALAKAFSTPERELFRDPDMKPTPEQALQVLADALGIKTPKPEVALPKREIIRRLSALDESKFQALLPMLESALSQAEGKIPAAKPKQAASDKKGSTANEG